MHAQGMTCDIDTVLFDFGGVLADEGFANGLRAIAAKHGLNEADFLALARHLIHTTGYITGDADEAVYWQTIRERTGIADDDAALRREILSRFTLRPWMFDVVRRLRASGISLAILSDQTNWLDELNEAHDFFRYFDHVFNSYHLSKAKVDPSHFSDTFLRLGRTPERMLFIDDDEGHCERARRAGMNAIHFTGREQFLKELSQYCPGDWAEQR